MRRRSALVGGVVLVVAAIIADCASLQEQYNVRRTNLSCEDANRYAHQSMRSLGYAVTEFRLARLGEEGMIKGTKPGERGEIHTGKVLIRCEPGEVLLSAAEEQFLKQDLTFTRGFFLTFTSLADHAAESAAWERQRSGGVTGGGVKFKIQPQIGLESKLDFGEDLAGAGILAVKVTVENGSDRTYKLDPAAIELRPIEGDSKVPQLTLSAAATALARAAAADSGEGAPPPDPRGIETLLRERMLAARTLRPGDQADGFVYFPTGRYRRARATLVDVETEEPEGFLVEFQGEGA
jgi:hypothetical protein